MGNGEFSRMTSIQADEGFLKLQICLIAGSWQGRMNAVGDDWNPWAMKIRILREGVTWVHHSPIWITVATASSACFPGWSSPWIFEKDSPWTMLFSSDFEQHIARENWMFFLINPVDCFKNKASPLHNSSLFGCATSKRQRETPNPEVPTLQSSRLRAPQIQYRRWEKMNMERGGVGNGWMDIFWGCGTHNLGVSPRIFWLDWIFGGHLLAYGNFFSTKHDCHVTGKWKTLRILWSRVWVPPSLRATVIIKDDSAFSSGNFQFYDSLPNKLQ